MDFFNKLTQKAKETYEGASKKTGELAKEAKLRMKMNENKSDINELFREIGKKVYEKHVISEEISIKTDLEEECTKIDVLSAEIETCLNQIRELKDKKQCPNCFNEIDLDAKYCSHCGEKQDKEKAREVEIVETRNEQETVIDATNFEETKAESNVETTETDAEEIRVDTENNSEVVENSENTNNT